MKAKTIGYWAATIVTALLIGSGGVMQLLRTHDSVAGIVSLGYPVYFVVLLGAWKVLGAAVLVAPRLPRSKEWAYAGIVFDLTGAALSHAASKSALGNVIAPLLFTMIALASWALRPEGRALQPRGNAGVGPRIEGSSGLITPTELPSGSSTMA